MSRIPPMAALRTDCDERVGQLVQDAVVVHRGRGWHRGTSLETEVGGDRQAYGDVLTS